MKLNITSPAEHQRLHKLAQIAGVVPERTIPMYSGAAMTPNTSRFGSPAWAAEQKEAAAKWEKPRETQKNSKNKILCFASKWFTSYVRI